MATLGPTCHEAPPVVAEGYAPKGEYTTFNGLKTYQVGSTSSRIAVIDVYDVFGYASQTIQGADVLAHAAGCLVLMPDFFDGGFDLKFETYPQEERLKAFTEFASEGGSGYAPKCIAAINSAAGAIKTQFPSVEKIGAFGMCYGGKVVILASNQAGTAINASGQAHPARLAADDAKALKIPHLIMASKDEPAEDVTAFDKVEKPVGSETHTYPTMHHGWMGARAKLNESENAKEFSRGYEQLAKWMLHVLA
ncbi:MAG: hypothetical protein M1828_005932 [Chrysothrix sp. TS-e1954]|nr:MAG: hypothetical protein M1828_005932 [Chrysothrix sp. TS-e1954]